MHSRHYEKEGNILLKQMFVLYFSQKAGRWNAMHVRIAWEILHHQKKENPEKTATIPNLCSKAAELPPRPSHMFPSAGVMPRPHELSASFPAGLTARPPYETGPIPAGFLAGPPSHIGMFHKFNVNSFQRLIRRNSIYRKHSIAIRSIFIAIQ